jgi:hypothetical protein
MENKYLKDFEDTSDAEEKNGVSIESVAEEIFGADFIGEEAIRFMEDKLKEAGINVQFFTDDVALSCSIEQLEEARREKGTDRKRFLVMRPSRVSFEDEQGKYDGPITYAILKRLLKGDPFHNKGSLILNQRWHEKEPFLNEPLQPGYAMPTTEPLPSSIYISRDEQEKLLKTGEERRKVIEILWDTIAYYASTGKRLLKDKYDWSSTKIWGDKWMIVGTFRNYGVYMEGDGTKNTDLGICPTKFYPSPTK